MSGRVLLVEDTESSRYLQGTWLRRAGYEVTEAATGSEALTLVDGTTDLVVLDVHLPDMTGFEVCTAIKSNPSTAAVPVMHVSATAIDTASRTTGLERGADAYLVEPVDRTVYLATARSLIRTRVARRSTELVADRLARLSAATLPVSAADTLTRLLEAAAVGAADVFGMPAIAVAETDAGSTGRALCAGRGATPISDPLGPPLSAEWSSKPGYLSNDQLPDVWAPMFTRAGVRSRRWLVWPLIGRHGLVAAGLGIGLDDGVDVGPAERELLGRLADAVSVALEKLRAYTQEHTTAITLQRALLPDRLPRVPGLTAAARYIASSDGVSVGGDFYDVFVLPTGHVVVLVGDVQGHSLQAAVVMAELRFSLRAYLIEGDGPGAAVAAVDRLLQGYHPDVTATLALLVLDPDLRRAVLVDAGHIPPLVATPEEITYADEDGVMLGVPGGAHAVGEVVLPPGSTVVLVTDGLVERRGQHLDTGLAALAEAVADALADGTDAPEALADLLLDRLHGDGAQDDVALVVVRTDPAG
jgi:serine phosphatase RsbU (regulator of sigma subunit)/DNA-binding NarL/FixJ family response regulator